MALEVSGLVFSKGAQALPCQPPQNFAHSNGSDIIGAIPSFSLSKAVILLFARYLESRGGTLPDSRRPTMSLRAWYKQPVWVKLYRLVCSQGALEY